MDQLQEVGHFGDGRYSVMSNRNWWKISAISLAVFCIAMIFQVGGPAVAHDNEIVNANILTRVLHLRVGDMTGTAFTVEVDGRQYFVTAKHLTGEKDIEEIEIWRKGWHRLRVNVVGIGKGMEDIIVLSANEMLTQLLPVNVGSDGITVGQNVRFLGFPLGLALDYMIERGEMRLPLVKAGILSGMKFENKVSLLLVDGHNNKGFSGGPVIFKPLDNGEDVWKIAGVISAYRIEDVDVRDKMGRILGTADGNSGILLATGIESALKLIELNPIGFPVTGK